MCMGMIVMADIRHVQIAAVDPWAGAVDICRTNRYIAEKHIEVRFMPDAPYGDLQAALMGYVELAAGREMAAMACVFSALSGGHAHGAALVCGACARRFPDAGRIRGDGGRYVLAQLSPDELGK